MARLHPSSVSTVRSRWFVACGFATAFTIAIATPAAAQVAIGVKTLNQTEILQLPAQWHEPANHAFSFAAAVRTSATGFASNGFKVKRSTSSDAAVYQSLPAATPPLLPGFPSSSAIFDFKTVHDHAQAWATMTSNGVPWIWLRGFGDYKAEATASWNTTITIPAGSQREVVLRFVVPPAGVNGTTEAEGRNAWRARLRAELLVNGAPAWSSEALRLRVDGSGSANMTLLQQFGDELGFATNDEDTSTSNNSPASPIDKTTKLTLYLSVGRFDPGAVVTLSMIHRADVFSEPTGGGLHKCREKSNEWFCSGSSVTIDGSTAEAPRIYLGY